MLALCAGDGEEVGRYSCPSLDVGLGKILLMSPVSELFRVEAGV